MTSNLTSIYFHRFWRYLTSKFFQGVTLTFDLLKHLRSDIFLPFEIPYMTFYKLSIDTFSIFRTVFDIFELKNPGYDLDIWPVEVTWGRIYFCHSKAHFLSDTFSLSRSTVSGIIRIKSLKVAQNGGIWSFQVESHREIFLVLIEGLTFVKRRWLTYRASKSENRSSRFGCVLIKDRKKLKNK